MQPNAYETPRQDATAILRGYLRYDRAILCARLGYAATVIAKQVLTDGWIHPRLNGDRRARPVPIATTALAESFGCDRGTILRAVKRLVAGRVLILDASGGYLLNPDFRQWMRHDVVAIDPACYPAIESGPLPSHVCPVRLAAPAPPDDPGPAAPAPQPGSDPAAPAPQAEPGPAAPAPLAGACASGNLAPAGAPASREEAFEESYGREEKEKLNVCVKSLEDNTLAHAGAWGARTAATQPGDVVPDPAELEATIALIHAHMPNSAIEMGIHTHKFVYPSSWLRKAIKRTACVRPTARNFGYVHAILKSWFAAGGPDDGPEDEVDDALRRLPPRATIPIASAADGKTDEDIWLEAAQAKLDEVLARHQAMQRGMR